MPSELPRLFLARHGDTAWTDSRQRTGRTDIPLNAVGEDRARLVGEAADVLYHLLVVLHARGISLDEVEAELAARTRQSGLEEKAARKSG